MSSETLAEKTFAQPWEIKDWAKVVQTETCVQNTKTKIVCKLEDVFSAKFVVGLVILPPYDGESRYIRFYWKLHSKHFCLENVHATVIVETFNRDGQRYLAFQKEANAVVVGKVEIFDDNFFTFAFTGDISTHTNSKGALVTKVYVNLKRLPKLTCGSIKEEFDRECLVELVKNMGSLLGEDAFGDVMILTRDGTKLSAHKAILSVRCPVFASMFRSEFLETKTGIVILDDIGPKTMKILLNYWYTGELLRSWRDNDIIVEFTYAAEKYQMTQVLKMLDDLLGCGFISASTDVELLKMVQKVSLENAEARLLKRIVHNCKNTTSGAELLSLLPLFNDKVNEENLEAVEILESFEKVLSDEDLNDACVNDMKLLEMSCKLGLKNVENKFVQRVIRTVSTFKSSDQLFELIGMKNEETKEADSKENDLLVRANSM